MIFESGKNKQTPPRLAYLMERGYSLTGQEEKSAKEQDEKQTTG